MKIVALIPARGGSKGIPNKNIIPFCGKPLIYWTIKQAKDSNIFKYICYKLIINHLLNYYQNYYLYYNIYLQNDLVFYIYNMLQFSFWVLILLFFNLYKILL